LRRLPGASALAEANRYPLIQSAKLNSIDPLAYITDLLTRIVSRQTKSQQLHQLLPRNWKSAISPALQAAALLRPSQFNS